MYICRFILSVFNKRFQKPAQIQPTPTAQSDSISFKLLPLIPPGSGFHRCTSTHADFPSLSSFVALAPFLERSDTSFSTSPCSTAASSRSSFLFHSLTFDRRGIKTKDDGQSDIYAVTHAQVILLLQFFIQLQSELLKHKIIKTISKSEGLRIRRFDFLCHF